ncbi:MAG TPA: hypothetical protein VFS12_16785, partial [Terriglobia bacterium]|nr:hypothetical protein [Terriglobia bacterium]
WGFLPYPSNPKRRRASLAAAVQRRFQLEDTLRTLETGRPAFVEDEHEDDDENDSHTTRLTSLVHTAKIPSHAERNLPDGNT